MSLKSIILPSVAVALGLLSLQSLCAMTPQEIEAARGVIERFAGAEVAQSLTLESLPEADGLPVFEIADNGRTLRGSSPVALCKAFYTNVTAKGAGICAWSGNRFDAEAAFTPSAPVRTVSPFKHHQYMNVVTHGYTTPYWDEARWMREIDWMALHGFDMPMAQIANEAIAERVWKDLGLTDAEIESYLVGPAHLPWMRMGNLCEAPDAPQPKAWRERQIRLQHAVLKRMRSLGMKPIVPAFGGFLPPAIRRVHPEAKLLRMTWAGAFHAWFLSPDQPLFRTVGTRYVKAWEKEFGPCTYYLADSFNEMELPWHTEAEKQAGLAHCGENVFGAIRDANPKAVWTMQGWMFGYQRHIWTPDRLKALLSRVPDDRMLLLDMAVDYNRCFWNNGYDWDVLHGFFGKPWVWSTIPNMGGKSAPTGVLAFYANGHLEALRSSNRGRLEGFGTAPEGFENNEVLYELIADASWRSTSVNLKDWLMHYSRCRYGAAPAALADYWQNMLGSVYGGFTAHPRFAWQLAPGTRRGSVQTNDRYFGAIRAFASCSDALKSSPLYRLDLREQLAFGLGAKLETALNNVAAARDSGDVAAEKDADGVAEKLFLTIDRLLAGHPNFDLRTWIGYARNAAEGNEALADYYESNARRLVTIWGPPVNDYSARIWSGLTAGYYLERCRRYADAERFGKPADIAAFENRWVAERLPLPDPGPAFRLDETEPLVKLMDSITAVVVPNLGGETVGAWSPTGLSADWGVREWTISLKDLRSASALRFRYTKGAHRLDIDTVEIVADGKIVFSAQPNGFAGTPSRRNFIRLDIPDDATGNNSCVLRARVRGNGGNDSYGVLELIFRK